MCLVDSRAWDVCCFFQVVMHTKLNVIKGLGKHAAYRVFVCAWATTLLMPIPFSISSSQQQ